MLNFERKPIMSYHYWMAGLTGRVGIKRLTERCDIEADTDAPRYRVAMARF